MLIKRSKGEVIFDTCNVIFMSLFMLATFYPFYYVIVASLSDPMEVIKSGGVLFYPKGLSLTTYSVAFQHPLLLPAYKNTIVYVVLGTSINILLTSLGAYALSRKNLYGGSKIMLMIVFTMFFGGGMIPNFLVVRYLGLLDTIGAMVLPGAISSFNLIIMRTQMASIPESVVESAKMDGAHDFTILFRIMLPLALPTVAVITLYYSVDHWNSFFNAMVYIRDRRLFPLQLVLRDMLMNRDAQASGQGDNTFAIAENLKYATIVITTLPILMAYPFLQKYFVKGILIGSVKG